MSAKPQSTIEGANIGEQYEAARKQIDKALPAIRLASVRGSAIALQFASQIVVGLLAGASGLGILQLATSWTCIVGEVIALGLPSRAMRRVAVEYPNGDTNAIENLLTDSRRKIISAWGLLLASAGLLITIIAFWSPVRIDLELFWIGLTAIIAAPVFALMKLYSESLKSSSKTLLAISLESLAAPCCLLMLCFICWIFELPAIALALVAAFVASLFIAAIAMRLSLNKALINVNEKSFNHTQDQVSEHKDLFFLWSNGVLSIAFLHMPFLVMPMYMTTADIGVFSIAHKLINVVTTLLLLMAAIFGPRFARIAASGDKNQLAVTLRKTQIISCGVFFPSAAFLILFATPLGNLFGEEFEQLQWYLLVLCVGQMVNAATGLAGVLLNMTGFASRELISLTSAFVFSIAGSVLIGPTYGAQGLVIVFSASIALKNILSYCLALSALRHWDQEQ